ncbi:MAG: alpha-amylase, partial [Pedobacter sp.]
MKENYTLLQFFEWYLPDDGQHWNRLSKEAAHLKGIGIDSIWLPPAHKGMSGSVSTGYDSYDLYDLGEFDQKGSVRTKYGTKEEFLNAVNAAKEVGLTVYADIVLNHLGGADESEEVIVRKVNTENRVDFISESFQIEAFTRFNYAARQDKYSAFKWDFQCFSGVDYDAASQEEGVIYSIQNQYGEGWDEVPGNEHGNFDYLMLCDIEFRNPAVVEELKAWGKWLLETTSVDGFRLDAVKHMPAGFYNDWLDTLRAESGAELFAVGEYWTPHDLSAMLSYIDETGGRMSLFDAPLQNNFSRASQQGNSFDLRSIFDNTLVATKPELAVTIVENHDTQPLQALEQPVAQWFRPLAYALILLREAGYPCVFYTDIYGSKYNDVGEDGQQHEIILEPLAELQQLLMLRKKYAYGEQIDYFDHPNCVGWVRGG